MDDKDKELEDKLNEIVKSMGDTGFIIANPETIKRLKDRGLPFQSRFITYKEYLDKLFKDKRKLAEEIIGDLPLINNEIAHSAVQSLYEQVRECYALGIFGATITLSSVLLELSLKYRLHKERTKSDPNYKWEEIEKLNFAGTLSGLKKIGVLSQEEWDVLNNFNIEVRNPYIHYNIKKLVRDVMIRELPVVKIETGEKKIHKDVKIVERPYLWFTGKKFLDKAQVNHVLNFCIGWVNKILSN